MLALFLGLVALAIAILYSSAYDKIANEIRDIRIKCIRIENIYSNQIKNNKAENNNKNIETENNNKIIEAEDDNEDYIEDDPEYEWEMPELTQNIDYYDDSVFKETFSNEDIIEEFI